MAGCYANEELVRVGEEQKDGRGGNEPVCL